MSTQNLLIDEIYFSGGLDTDSDEKFVSQGDYVDALNISKFYDGSGGVLTNTSGNSEISNTYLPAGTNKCIGWCEDEENNAIIFFNYNSNNNHGIYRLLKDTDTFQKILHNKSVLAFDAETTNLQAYVIGGILYWNEGKDLDGNFINNPRKLNLLKAYRYTNSLSGDKYRTIDKYVLSVIKPPYLGYLNAIFTTDLTYTGVHNFIGNKYYKFAIQLVYDDNEVSVLGNYSNAALWMNDNHNCLALRFFYQDFSETVSKIRIYCQENFIGTPYLIAEEDVKDCSNMYDPFDNVAQTALQSGYYAVYRWYGNTTNKAYGGSSQLYDSVPVYANSFAITDNRLMYGDCVVDVDVSEGGLDYSVIDADDSNIYDSSAFTVTFGSYSTGAAYTVDILPILNDFIPSDSTHFADIFLWSSREVDAGAYFGMDIKIECQGICPYWNDARKMAYIIDNSRVYGVRRSDSAVIDGVLSSYTSAGVTYLRAYLNGCDYVVTGGADYSNEMMYSKANLLTYKSGSRRFMCVSYFDYFGRTIGGIIGDGEVEYVPRKTTLSGGGIFGFTTQIQPSTQDIAYMSVSISDNLEWLSVLWYSSAIYSGSPNNRMNLPSNYEYKEGDVVRLAQDGSVWKIIDADATYLYFSEDIGYSSGAIEILTPRSSGDPIVFHEIKTFNTGLTPVVSEYGSNPYYDVIISDGDVAGRDYTLSSSARYAYESFTDTYGNSIRLSGRPMLEKQDFEQKEFQNVYFSNKYFDNTSINGLSTFISTNRAELNDENGDIIDLKRVGEVLYAIQRNEITSFYVGKAILKQSSTGEVTADTSQILAGKRESSFDFGSVFQTARLNNYLFGYDIYRGIFWMNGYNGIQIISGKTGSTNYKMDAYFKEKSKALLASGISNIEVKIGIDKTNETVYVSFIDNDDSDNNDTLAYHVPSNRWISRYSFIPEMYAWKDDKFYTLKSGKLYMHDDDTADKNTFYGTSYESEIKFVSHLAPNVIKIFNSIAIHSDDNWSNEYIQISPSTSYPNGMYTKVLDSEWINEEGVQKYEIPKNMKTRTSVINNYDRINGEDMRGNVIEVKLTNDSTNKVELFKVDVISELSK